MGASHTLDQVWDTVDEVIDAAERVAKRFRSTMSNAHRVAGAYRSASVPTTPPVVSDDAEIVEKSSNKGREAARGTSRFYMVKKGADYVVTDGKHATAICPSRETAQQVLDLVRQLERDAAEGSK